MGASVPSPAPAPASAPAPAPAPAPTPAPQICMSHDSVFVTGASGDYDGVYHKCDPPSNVSTTYTSEVPHGGGMFSAVFTASEFYCNDKDKNLYNLQKNEVYGDPSRMYGYWIVSESWSTSPISTPQQFNTLSPACYGPVLGGPCPWESEEFSPCHVGRGVEAPSTECESSDSARLSGAGGDFDGIYKKC